MKIEIIKDGAIDAKTGKHLKVGSQLKVEDDRGQKAIDKGAAKLVEESKTKKKKSTQEKVSEKTTKK